jgi:hypothetical protein
MTLANIQAIINGKEDKVIAIAFDNNTKKIFGENQKFSIAKNLDTTNGFFVFEEELSNGAKIKSYKPVEDVQTIVMIDDDGCNMNDHWYLYDPSGIFN